MEIGIALGALALALLAYIAAQLSLLRKDLAALAGKLRLSEDRKDSPTINVNLGNLPLQENQAKAPSPRPGLAPSSPSSQATPARQGSSAQQAEPGEMDEGETEPEKKEPARFQATPSGQRAIKCPRCQSENSSYRIECFNCGASLT